MAKTQFNRRNFLQTSAIGASALSLSAASAARVYGANEKINIAFLGVGGRCQQHVDVILQMQKENKIIGKTSCIYIYLSKEILLI